MRWWGTTILSLASPPVATLGRSLTTSSPSLAMAASLVYCLMWAFSRPTLLEGVLPVYRHQ